MKLNIHEKAYSDPRFARAALKLKMHRYDVLGRATAVWHFGYQARTDMMSMADIDGLAEKEGFAAAMLEAGLAEKQRGRGREIRVKGMREYLEWLRSQSDKSARGVEARRTRGQPVGQPVGNRRVKPTGNPAVLDPDPDPDPVPAADPAPDPDSESKEQQQQEQQTAEQLQQQTAEQLQQQASPAVRSGWTPPAGGLADREAKRRIAAGEITIADVDRTWTELVRKVEPTKLEQGEIADRIALKFIERARPSSPRSSTRKASTAIASNDDWTEEDEVPPWEL